MDEKRWWKWGLIGGALLGGLAIGGCAGHHSWPPQKGEVALKDVDAPVMQNVIVASLQWAVKEYPVPQAESGPSYAVNLPTGTNQRVYAWMVRHVGPGAVPLTPENSHLPTYHIKEVRVRSVYAEVDVLHPVPSMGLDPRGEPVYQMVTAYLEGGFHPWKVTSRKEWSIGTATPPEPNYFTGDFSQTTVTSHDE